MHVAATTAQKSVAASAGYKWIRCRSSTGGEHMQCMPLLPIHRDPLIHCVRTTYVRVCVLLIRRRLTSFIRKLPVAICAGRQLSAQQHTHTHIHCIGTRCNGQIVARMSRNKHLTKLMLKFATSGSICQETVCPLRLYAGHATRCNEMQRLLHTQPLAATTTKSHLIILNRI